MTSSSTRAISCRSNGSCWRAGPRRGGSRCPASDLDGVHTLRTLADAREIRERAARSERALVTGPNFIGLETTASLTQRGVQVTLVVRGNQLFPALAVPAFSRFLDDLYREHGVELLYEDEVAEVTGEAGRIATVKTKGGEEREADLLVAGIGVTPNTAFLDGAGLEIDDGVLVNERFETSRQDVWAIGDVARFFDPVYGRPRRIEHASNASYQGTELGKVLAGSGPGYDQVSLFFSEVFGAGIRFLGDHTGHDALVEHGDFHEGSAVTLHTAGGRIVAALAMGQEDDVLERLKELIRAKAPAGEFALGRPSPSRRARAPPSRSQQRRSPHAPSCPSAIPTAASPTRPA